MPQQHQSVALDLTTQWMCVHVNLLIFLPLLSIAAQICFKFLIHFHVPYHVLPFPLSPFSVLLCSSFFLGYYKAFHFSISVLLSLPASCLQFFLLVI
jgi:hypothetical protein